VLIVVAVLEFLFWGKTSHKDGSSTASFIGHISKGKHDGREKKKKKKPYAALSARGIAQHELQKGDNLFKVTGSEH